MLLRIGRLSAAGYHKNMMRQSIDNKNSFTTLLAGAALACFLALPSAAQPAQSEPANSPAQLERQERQQPTIRTYDKFPDPSGNDQDIDATTYDKSPNSDGDAQSLDFVRYQEQNEDNNGENPVNLVIIEEDDPR